MKTNTGIKIFAFIAKNPGVNAKQIIANSGLNATGIFRHLKKMLKNKKIYKIGKPPLIAYFSFNTNMKNPDIIKRALDWAISGSDNFSTISDLCPARDSFQARLERLLADLQRKKINAAIAYSVISIIGEVGNNSFDHNLGNWRDTAGINFIRDLDKRIIIVADRGQGIMATLKNVKPEIANDKDALHVAFTETISGRYPEQRGNGLKYVKKVIEENNLYLKLYSGQASCVITSAGMDIHDEKIHIPGTLAIIQF